MLNWMISEISSRPLGLTRIVVGGTSVIRGILAWPILNGLVDRNVVRFPYAEWLPEPTMPLVTAIALVWIAAGVLFMLGWRVSATGPLLLLAIVASLAVDQQMYDNHVYLMAWLVFLLTLADAGAGVSISHSDRPVIRWPVLLLMVQTSVVYGFSGLTKLNEYFLSGATLAAVLRDGIVPFPGALRSPGFLSVLAPTVVFVELFIAVMIWRRRFRPFAFIFGLGLHVAITLLMASTLQLLVFSLEMLALYPLFVGGEVLAVEAPEKSDWKPRIARYDLLQVVNFAGEAEQLRLVHHGVTSRGAEAYARILEHLVPWLWIAPLLRVPLIKWAYRRLLSR